MLETPDDVRRAALGASEAPEGQAWGLVYIGDQVGRVADALDGLLQRVDQIAPARCNGAGEVLGRVVEVAAAIRAEVKSAPAGLTGA